MSSEYNPRDRRAKIGPQAGRFTRFHLSHRLEHLVLMVSFTALCITGIPQKFHEAGWADWMIGAMGNIETVRFLHRFFAIVFMLEAVYHFAYVGYVLLIKKGAPTMLPTWKDAGDAFQSFKYFLGLAPRPPKFDRYDFRQKFEYWGLVWGGLIMIITGLILWFPVEVTQFVPGILVPAAKAAHGWEAVLALLTIVTWHFYNAHLNPHALPFDESIFTGKISEERMMEEHPLEYERLTGEKLDWMEEEEGRPAKHAT